MEKSKLDALRKLGLTKEEAREWIDILAKESIVKAPLAIVYELEQGCFDAKPFLDLSRKKEVIGVLINDVVWPLIGQKENIDYYNARKMLTNGLELPSVADMEQVNDRIESINQTFELLRTYGIDAMDFVKTANYWTSQQWSINNETKIAVYSMSERCRYEYDPSRGKIAFARVCFSFYSHKI